MRTGVEELAVGIATQLRDRMQLECHHFINIFLLGKVAVHRVIGDHGWQAVTLVRQLLFVEIYQRLFLFLFGRRLSSWRCLCTGDSESAAARDIHDGECGNLQPAFGTPRAAIEEVAEPKSLLATLGNER